MFQQIGQELSAAYWFATQKAGESSLFVIVALVLILSLFSWRVWTFSIVPALYPQEPKTIPYWIPHLGHAIRFFQDYEGTFAYGKRYFHNGNETYKINIGGRILYIMTSPQEISKIYKSTATLTYDVFIREVLLSLGTSLKAVDLWIPLSQTSQNAANGTMKPLHKDFVHVGERLCQQQLLPGEKLEVLQHTFLSNIQAFLAWQNIPGKCILSSTTDRKTVSLLAWCSEVLLSSATHTFFGPRLLEIEPGLLEAFSVFDANSWKLHYGYPRFLSQGLYAAKDKIHVALITYFKLREEERPGASWLIHNFEVEMKKKGIEEKDIAAIIVAVYWVTNANAYKACFWMMSFILHDHNLYTLLRAEIEPACSEGVDGLAYRLESCPQLNAVLYEVLRLTSSTSTIRSVEDTTYVGDKVLRKNTDILIPYRQLHLDESVFGPNPSHFNARRFLNNKDLSRSPSFRPFGGGSTYCPGRYIAQREILVFVALALYRFDLTVATDDDGRNYQGRRGRSVGRSFPKIDSKKLCLGIQEPMKGEDVFVNIAKTRL